MLISGIADRSVEVMELDRVIREDFGGDADAFKEWFGYSRDSGERFNVEELTVLDGDTWVTIWPRPGD